MILLMALISQGDATAAEITRWFQAARRAALEVPGVYDLALYGGDASQTSSFWCALDVEDEQASSAFWQDQQVQQALKQGARLGLALVQQSRWERRG